jgi:pimeloyl-ACP methyl ester carboxylesterase
MGTASDHTVWGAQVIAYRTRFRTIVYDARGTGRSGKPADVEGYSTTSMADDAALLLDALGIDGAHVSGLSLGSAVAQELALRHPGRVRTLQLHATWGRADEGFLATLGELTEPALRGEWGALGRAAVRLGLSPAFREESPAEAARLARAHVVDNPHPPSAAGILGHLRADRTHDALGRLGSIACPTLVTTGEIDGLTPPHLGRAVAERIPGADLHAFTGPRSSHLLALEMADAFNRRTLEWLARHAGLSAS